MISGKQVSAGLKGVIAAGIMVAVSLILSSASGQEQRPNLGPRPGAVRSNAPNRKGRILDERRLLEATIIPGVPAYLSRHGSGPTAAAMVLAYHDARGFPELLPGNASVQTDLVNLAIASQEHYNDYCLPLDAPPTILPDKSELPEEERHPDNCLADRCLTSRSLYGNYYGQTKDMDLKPGIEDFGRAGGRYITTTATYPFAQVDWTTIRNEVLSNRPMVFLMDADGDSLEDLFVTVIGFYTEKASITSAASIPWTGTFTGMSTDGRRAASPGGSCPSTSWRSPTGSSPRPRSSSSVWSTTTSSSRNTSTA